MVIGNGLIAAAFRARYGIDDDTVVFASGVSNSSERDAAQFERERIVLNQALQAAEGRLFIYFSSCAVDLPSLPTSRYVEHKRLMERRVLAAPGGTVFRLPQVVGRTGNPNTLINYLVRHIVAGAPFQVFKGAQRNLVDIDDVALLVPELLRSHSARGAATNIAASEPTEVHRIVTILEGILRRTANAIVIERQEPYTVQAPAARDASRHLGLGLDEGEHYTRSVLGKYYG